MRRHPYDISDYQGSDNPSFLMSKILMSKILAQPVFGAEQRAKPLCYPLKRPALPDSRERADIARIVASDLDKIVNPITRLEHRHAIRIWHGASLTGWRERHRIFSSTTAERTQKMSRRARDTMVNSAQF
jgi:hypothetical protein